MQTLSALLLFVSAASAFAFPSNGRQRRGAPGSGAGAGATSGSFATSGAYGNGYGGAGSFAFPGPSEYGPSSFESAFRSYFDQMESLLAAQQAHAQALSNRFWTDWRSNIVKHSEGPQLTPHAGGAAAAFSPNYYYHYSGTPTASHSHSAFSFRPHRFNAASANAIPNNNVDAGQVPFSSPAHTAGTSQYASVFSGNGAGFGSGFGGAGGGGHGSGHGTGSSLVGSGLGGAAHGAQASLSVNNRGGFGQAQLFPDPGLSSRISGDIAPLSGGSFGVFSSSSSSSHSDPSGKTHTFKQATVGVNDNGKVSTFSVKDP